jgi:hypothetical protein
MQKGAQKMENENIRQLDSDEKGTLYSVTMPLSGLTVSIYVATNGDEYVPTDWQCEQAMSMRDTVFYDWVLAEEVANF